MHAIGVLWYACVRIYSTRVPRCVVFTSASSGSTRPDNLHEEQRHQRLKRADAADFEDFCVNAFCSIFSCVRELRVATAELYLNCCSFSINIKIMVNDQFQLNAKIRL